MSIGKQGIYDQLDTDVDEASVEEFLRDTERDSADDLDEFDEDDALIEREIDALYEPDD